LLAAVQCVRTRRATRRHGDATVGTFRGLPASDQRLRTRRETRRHGNAAVGLPPRRRPPLGRCVHHRGGTRRPCDAAVGPAPRLRVGGRQGVRARASSMLKNKRRNREASTT
jgi:hypothetical protein